jgi:thioredoxin 1
MIKISESQFQKEVLESKVPVLVDFYTETCQPCKALDKILSKIKTIKIVKVDVMESQTVAGNFMVQMLPTTIIFSNGQVIRALEGLHKPKKYEEMVEACAIS